MGSSCTDDANASAEVRTPPAPRGVRCGRRVRKLYLPPGGRYFGCRHCYRLTYTSCQESHQYDRLINTIAAEMGIDGIDDQTV